MRMLVVAILTIASAVGCTSMPLLKEPWTIEGQLVTESDGKPMSSATIELLRFNGGGILYGYDKQFVSVQTDADGRFWISSPVAGSFTVSSKCPTLFGGLFEPLGRLHPGQHVRRNFVFHSCIATH